MAVKIRLSRRGRKKLAIFDIIIADARSPRDGKIIEKIGTYNPNINPAQIILDETKALEWLMQGAQPTDTVRAILSYKGILLRKHLQIGVNKKAITQEEADKKFNAWLKEKEAKINKKIESIETSKKEADKKKLEDEKVANKKTLDKIKQKLEEANAKKAKVETPAEETKVEAPAEETKVEAPAEETKKETPAEEAKVETPTKKTKKETPTKKTKKETPAKETKKEAPAKETKEEASARETKEKKEKNNK